MTRNDRIAEQAIAVLHAEQYASTLTPGTAQHAVATTHAAREHAGLRNIIAEALPSDQMPPEVRRIIMHALAARDAKPRGATGCRNYYAPPGPGSGPHGLITLAVDRGWMEWGSPYRDSRYAYVTEEGARAAGPAALFAYRRHERSLKPVDP
jgi:hypothetical protein